MIAKSWCSSVTHFSPSSLPSPWKLLFVFPIFVSAYWTRVPARDSDEPLVESNACGWNFLTIPKWAYSSSFILKQMDQCQTNRVSDRTLGRKRGDGSILFLCLSFEEINWLMIRAGLVLWWGVVWEAFCFVSVSCHCVRARSALKSTTVFLLLQWQLSMQPLNKLKHAALLRWKRAGQMLCVFF